MPQFIPAILAAASSVVSAVRTIGATVTAWGAAHPIAYAAVKIIVPAGNSYAVAPANVPSR